MRFLLVLMCLISFNSFASADYSCTFRNYKLEIDMTNDESTGLFVIERWRYETLYVGYVGFIERKNKISNFYFYGNEGEIILTFKNSELLNEKDKLSASIEAQLEGFYFVDKFYCYKRK